MSRDRDVLVYWIGGPVATAVLAVCLIPLRDLTPVANLTFAFVALTIVVAEFGGRAAGLATAVASAVSLDFFLTRPYLRMAIEDKPTSSRSSGRPPAGSSPPRWARRVPAAPART